MLCSLHTFLYLAFLDQLFRQKDEDLRFVNNLVHLEYTVLYLNNLRKCFDRLLGSVEVSLNFPLQDQRIHKLALIRLYDLEDGDLFAGTCECFVELICIPVR